MNNWRYKLFQIMQGRNGIDDFGKFLLIAAIAVIFLSNLFRLHIVHLAGIALLLYAYFRIMSRNIYKRQQENQKYMAIRFRFSKKQPRGPVTNHRQNSSGPKNENRQYNFYRCRKCGQTVRVPKGKGRLKITCPNCGNTFVDET